MAGCKVKHDNPFCSTTERKIHVDVAHEIDRIWRLKNCSEKPKHHPTGHFAQIQQSEDYIRAVAMGCARGSRKLASEFLAVKGQRP